MPVGVGVVPSLDICASPLATCFEEDMLGLGKGRAE